MCIVPGNSLSVTQTGRKLVWSDMHICVHKVTLVGVCLLQLQFLSVFEMFQNDLVEFCRRHRGALTVTFTKTLDRLKIIKTYM